MVYILTETIIPIFVIYILLLCSDEYDILPSVESTTNRNPVVLIDHKLAVEAWAARLMFCTAVSSFRQWQKTPVFNADGKCSFFCYDYSLYLVCLWYQKLCSTLHCQWSEDLDYHIISIISIQKIPKYCSNNNWCLLSVVNCIICGETFLIHNKYVYCIVT